MGEADFNAKYDSLVAIVTEKRDDATAGLRDLQAKFSEAIGKEDPAISARIAEAEAGFCEHLAQLGGVKAARDAKAEEYTSLQKAYSEQMGAESPDIAAKAAESDSEHCQQLDELTAIYEGIENEGAGSQPAAAEEVVEAVPAAADVEAPMIPAYSAVQVPVPVAELPHYETVQEEIERTGDNELAERAQAAIGFIETKVRSGIYDLMGLTKDELFGLGDAVKKFTSAPSGFRMEEMMPFLESPHVRWQMQYLGNEDRRAIEYALKRDRKSHPGEFKPATKKRQANIARIILAMYSGMIDETAMFRHSLGGDRDGIEIGTMFLTDDIVDADSPAAAVFCIEKFLVEKVLAERLPAYNKAAYEMMGRILAFHDNVVAGALGKAGAAELNVGYQVKTMRSMAHFYENRGYRTAKQRRFALILALGYRTNINVAGPDVKERITLYDPSKALPEPEPEEKKPDNGQPILSRLVSDMDSKKMGYPLAWVIGKMSGIKCPRGKGWNDLLTVSTFREFCHAHVDPALKDLTPKAEEKAAGIIRGTRNDERHRYQDALGSVREFLMRLSDSEFEQLTKLEMPASA